MRLRSEGREGLRRFRETSACDELETSDRSWRVVAWPWTCDPPLRVVLEDDDHNAVAFTLGESGNWLLTAEPRVTYIRSREELDCEARADLGDPCYQPHIPGLVAPQPA